MGAVLLLLEYLSLFFIRNASVRLGTEAGIGFYSDPLKYASVAPMPTVFTLTIILIVLGGLLAAGSLLYPLLAKRKG